MERIFLDCEHCGEALKVVAELAGRKVRCPSCLSVSIVPMPSRHEVEALSTVGAVEQSTIDLPADEADQSLDEQGFRLRLELDEGYTFAHLEIERGVGGVSSKSDILSELKARGVVFGIHEENVGKIADRLKADDVRAGERICVASWRPPQPAIADSYALIEPETEEGTNHTEDSKGRVDFKEVKTIYVVVEGELVARLVPGEDGLAGCKLNGARVEIEPSEDESQRLGDGVNFDAANGLVYATRSGRPAIVDNVLDVLQVYEVEGDVDFSIGNVRFDGHVVVRGSILDEFELECKSLEVHGTVGAATIYCATDAALHGGVNGNGKCRLYVGGRCEVKYLNQVIAHVGGDLIVERGITNSQIICWGTMEANRVVGGRSAARLGYTIEDLGSELGVVTIVAPGMIALPSYGQKISDEPDEASAKAVVGDSLLQPIEASDSEGQLDGETEQEIILSTRQSLLERFVSGGAENIDHEVALDEKVFMVNVTSKMHADVIVCTDSRCREFVEKSSGKMSISLDEETGNYEKGPFRRLRVSK